MASEPDVDAALRRNLDRVRGALADRCRLTGRDPGGVRLIAVTKYVPIEVVRSLIAIGVRDVGETRVQQLVQRADVLGVAPRGLNDTGDGPGPVWHMVGHLQRNKVKALLHHSRILHSLDSLRLAEEVQRRAVEAGVIVDAFIEVNVAGEQSKTGVAPQEVPRLAEAVLATANIRLHGLMTMAPLVSDPEAARPCFAGLRALLERLRRQGHVPPECDQLSMGMSSDYAVAVDEGATIVRIGSALFALDTPPGAKPRSRYAAGPPSADAACQGFENLEARGAAPPATG